MALLVVSRLLRNLSRIGRRHFLQGGEKSLEQPYQLIP
jgi:hypothetical protein